MQITGKKLNHAYSPYYIYEVTLRRQFVITPVFIEYRNVKVIVENIENHFVWKYFKYIVFSLLYCDGKGLSNLSLRCCLKHSWQYFIFCSIVHLIEKGNHVLSGLFYVFKLVPFLNPFHLSVQRSCYKCTIYLDCLTIVEMIITAQCIYFCCLMHYYTVAKLRYNRRRYV